MLKAMPGAENARIASIQRRQDHRSRQAVRLTCCSMSSALVRVEEVKQKEMDWPNTTVLFFRDNPRSCQDARLFTCIHLQSLFLLRSLLSRLMSRSLDFIRSSGRGPCEFPSFLDWRCFGKLLFGELF